MQKYSKNYHKVKNKVQKNYAINFLSLWNFIKNRKY